MVADRSKKAKLEDENADQIDGELLATIEKLQEVQDELEKIDERASEEVLRVERRFNEVRKPIYEKRNEIIKSIPDFWLTAFLSHPALEELLTEKDQKIFRHLSSLEVEDAIDIKSGYSIRFNFNPNPYFEDSQLTKTFTFVDKGPTKITATPIKWKEGMGLTIGDNRNEKNKGIKRSLAEESFFTWFTDAQTKEDSEDECHDQIAVIIKEELWPNPLSYFNNDDDEEIDGDDDDRELNLPSCFQGKDDDDDDDEDEEDEDGGGDE